MNYRIVYYGEKAYLAWNAEKQVFVPAGLHLYVTDFFTADDCEEELMKVRNMFPEMAKDIYMG